MTLDTVEGEVLPGSMARRHEHHILNVNVRPGYVQREIKTTTYTDILTRLSNKTAD